MFCYCRVLWTTKHVAIMVRGMNDVYIVLNDVIVYAGKPGPIGYKMAEVEKWLETYSS